MPEILTIAFLAAWAITLLLRLWLALRQMRHVGRHRDAVPAQFAGRIALDAHQKAADYTRAKTSLAITARYSWAEMARESRRFLIRVVRHLAASGMRQFVDIGTGLPTMQNTHEVAQQIAPDSKIVYVDNDPLVLTHARALLTSSPEGATYYIDADLFDPELILRQAVDAEWNELNIVALGDAV